MGFGRQDVRLDKEIDVIAHSVYDEEGCIVPNVSDIPMKMLNLSATGVSLSCSEEFNEKQSFYIELTLVDESIVIMPIIVRKMQGKDDEWVYGCQFTHLDHDEEQAIRKYIFDCELKSRKIGVRR